ncbi:MAG: LCCL domain-containing protein [Microthrixaceae bacterium]|nr:LCCL domain-containing protein [Microthrixaceae bacterium]
MALGCSSEEKVAKPTSTTAAPTTDAPTDDSATEDDVAEGEREQQGEGPWSETAAAMRGENGTTAEFDCPRRAPRGGVGHQRLHRRLLGVHRGGAGGPHHLRRGGTVTIEIAAGEQEYFGSTYNDVESQPYGTWEGSFVFPDAEELEVAAEIAWDRAANFYANEEGPFTVTCMADGTPGSVWGTGPFTADSSICTAALFAGEITAEEGGEVTFELSEGLDSYEGGEANGVTTRSYGVYDSSFDFTG